MSFAKRLRELRVAMKLSQQQLANIVGVTKGAISQWELGMINPRHIKAENMEKLCHVLDKSVTYLLSGKGAKQSHGVREQSSDYLSASDAFLSECVLYVLENGEDLTNADKAVVVRLLYNQTKKNKTIRKKTYNEIIKLL